jgi:diacylglycerol kinase (ATP)
MKNAKLITAGGDGTVASVINYVKSINWNPPIAILPLGTGNDLSRALGWVIYLFYLGRNI